MAGAQGEHARVGVMEELINKWNVLYNQAGTETSTPAQILSENAFLLPEAGTALDLACGLGGNAVFLAQQQLAVTALDIAPVAIHKLSTYAARQGLNIIAHQQKIDSQSLNGQHYDVIAISRFLDRTLTDAIINALNPGGLLFYQTFTRERTTRHGPSNPDYLLAENELLDLFSPLRLIFYRDNALIGNLQGGLRGEAQFIGQKRTQA